MLIQCPKCGFSQPKDQYCANCGVDMESFRPQKPPLMGRILGSALFQISFVFIIVFVAIFYIRQKQKEELASRVEFLKGGPLIVEKSFTPNAGATTESSTATASEVQPTPPPPPPAMAPPPPATPPQTAVAGSLPQENRALETAPDRAKSTQHTKMRLIYAEVDKTTLDILREEAQASGQYTDFGDFKAGALSATRKVTRERGVRVLFREEKDITQQGQPQSWFTGTTGTGGEPLLGFQGVAAIETTARGQIKGEVEVHRLFRESLDPNSPPVSRPYPATSFELNPGMTWMMSLNLPMVPQEEAGKTETDGVLRIFQSPQFKSGRTEFTLFIEFDTPAPK